MTPKQKEILEKKICKYLSGFTHQELREMKINGQQAVKIKHGEIVHFYAKTLARLRKLVEKTNVA